MKSWHTQTDDWDSVDGMPRWVWRADDEFSKMPGVSSHSDLMERAQELTQRAEALRLAYFRDWGPDRFQRWLAPRLEECRRVRNLTTNPMDGTKPMVMG